MGVITTKDGTEIFYKDWGSGRPVVFSHGWPLSADAWDDQMVLVASRGFRAIAHDRRGHGRSEQPWSGNDMDTYADDLAALLDVEFPESGKAVNTYPIAALKNAPQAELAKQFLAYVRGPVGREVLTAHGFATP